MLCGKEAAAEEFGGTPDTATGMVALPKRQRWPRRRVWFLKSKFQVVRALKVRNATTERTGAINVVRKD